MIIVINEKKLITLDMVLYPSPLPKVICYAVRSNDSNTSIFYFNNIYNALSRYNNFQLVL